MTNMTQITIDFHISADVRERVSQHFSGFIGNHAARRGVERGLMIALATDPPKMNKTYLFTGPRSSGKTELSKRIGKCLNLPYLSFDGRAVRTRDKLFDEIDRLLEERQPMPRREGDRAGLPVYVYERFCVFIDETHGMSEAMQTGLLPLLEKDDRTAIIENRRGRFVAMLRDVVFILATTEPARIVDPLRSRCVEIELEPYTAEEIVAILKARGEGFERLPADTLSNIATASRLTPRISIEMAREVIEELSMDPTGGVRRAFAEVMTNRGILTYTGLTRLDLRYLKLISNHPKKLMGQNAIIASLSGIDRDVITKDIERFLLSNGYISIKERGRAITWKGEQVVKEFDI